MSVRSSLVRIDPAWGKQDGLDDLVSFPGQSYAILVKAQREKPDSNPNPDDDLFVFAIIIGFSDCSTC